MTNQWFFRPSAELEKKLIAFMNETHKIKSEVLETLLSKSFEKPAEVEPSSSNVPNLEREAQLFPQLQQAQQFEKPAEIARQRQTTTNAALMDRLAPQQAQQPTVDKSKFKRATQEYLDKLTEAGRIKIATTMAIEKIKIDGQKERLLDREHYRAPPRIPERERIGDTYMPADRYPNAICPAENSIFKSKVN